MIGNYNKNKSKGFTIVELIIVLTLIGILSAFFINTSTTSLKRGRDAKRKSDLEQIRSGLETYRADCDRYPMNGQIVWGGNLVGIGTPTSCLASNTYINSIPNDPQQQGGTGPSYRYSSNTIQYEICAYLEMGTGTVTCGGVSDCGAGFTCNYKVISP